MNDKKNDIKPPLGIKPYFVAYYERISDIADAIKRTDDVNDIRLYVSEIILLCTLIEDMRKTEQKCKRYKEQSDDWNKTRRNDVEAVKS